jgi:hypothetical protein
VDLLTVIEHEIGNALGFPELYRSSQQVMEFQISTGVRRFAVPAPTGQNGGAAAETVTVSTTLSPVVPTPVTAVSLPTVQSVPMPTMELARHLAGRPHRPTTVLAAAHVGLDTRGGSDTVVQPLDARAVDLILNDSPVSDLIGEAILPFDREGAVLDELTNV